MPPAGRRRHCLGADHDVRRRHRACHGHQRDDVHAVAEPGADDAAGDGRNAVELRLLWEGQHLRARGADGGHRGRGRGAETARGLGHDPRRDRQRARLRGRERRRDHDPHGHHQRVGVHRRLHRRDEGPHDPHVPLRGRRRRARARHHQGVRPAERPAVLHQPDPAVHREHDRRAFGHADGLPPPQQEHPGGRRLRGVPDPRRDHRGGGHTPRPGGHLHHLLGLAGHGPHRRGHHAHVADRREDEGSARPAARGQHRLRQHQDQEVRREVHHQPRHCARHVALDRQPGGGEAGRHLPLAAGHVRRQARDGHQRGHHRVGADGGPERLHPHAAAGAHAADVRLVWQSSGTLLRHLRLEGRRGR
mmetsp:Transcript_113988/g.309690  ORF Transcript_113988/g.309690 Transcript_113988/m.309690 type:complete len:362 (+) Transcript_113988:355-1440(+)